MVRGRPLPRRAWKYHWTVEVRWEPAGLHERLNQPPLPNRQVGCIAAPSAGTVPASGFTRRGRLCPAPWRVWTFCSFAQKAKTLWHPPFRKVKNPFGVNLLSGWKRWLAAEAVRREPVSGNSLLSRKILWQAGPRRPTFPEMLKKHQGFSHPEVAPSAERTGNPAKGNRVSPPNNRWPRRNGWRPLTSLRLCFADPHATMPAVVTCGGAVRHGGDGG